MNHYDINERKNLGKVRKKSTGVLILVDLLLMAFFYIVYKFKHKLSLTVENEKTFEIVVIVAIVGLIFLMFLLILSLARPSYILQNDLKNIYIVKKHNKIIEIPVTEVKKVRARIRSKKKAKREFGTIVIITTKRKRYKIKNVYDVTLVKDNILLVLEKLQIYFEGIKEGSKYYDEVVTQN